MAKIIELTGNIFDSRCQVLVNTVNCVGVMGKGIALEFKNRFPEMFAKYQEVCELGQLTPGRLLLWTKSTPWILNFPTKKHWRHPSKLAYIEDGLDKFAATYSAKGITSIAFPQLGTQSGGLQWTEVRHLMLEKLESLVGLTVEIYRYDASVPDDLVDRLVQMFATCGPNDLVTNVGLPANAARVLSEALNRGEIKSVADLNHLKGFGKKSRTKVHEFLRSARQGPAIGGGQLDLF